jgi:hypothetical protein
MFSKFPDLFDKHFAVGFFLPITVFLATSLWLLNVFTLLSWETIINFNTTNNFAKLINVSIFVVMSWLLSILLLGANREIIRTMEGYGKLNPVRIFKFLEKKRFSNLQKAKIKLDEDFVRLKDSGEELPAKAKEKLTQTYLCLAERFPDEQSWLLPTSFGNIIRAFEVYSRVMYGLDAIPGWNRLVAVIPKDYYGVINDSKSIVDFWVNLWALSWVVALEYIVLLIYNYKGAVPIFWFPFAAVGISFLFFWRAKIAALEWGDFVKASFDVFLPALYEKLGFQFPENRDEEQDVWAKFSRAIIYRDPDELPPRKKNVENRTPNKEDLHK